MVVWFLAQSLMKVAEQLDPKYQFILQAPDADPEGNPTLVKFSRKNQAQYIGSKETPEQANQVNSHSGWKKYVEA